jgi:alpha-ketoglutarate-dependent taurine dioxygenase
LQGTGESGEFFRELHDERDRLERQLLEKGVLVFRGFAVDTPPALHRFCEALGAQLMDYPRGISPRTEVAADIYTSTEAPPGVPLPIHTEMSYTSTFPQAIAFCCVTAPGTGGETPIADMQKVLARLPEAMVSEFEERGVIYRQYAPSGHGNNRIKTWQDMFATEDRAEAEHKAGEQGVAIAWLNNGAAWLTNPGVVVHEHPVTGARCWFNQVGTFHHSMSAEFRYIGRPFTGALVRCFEFLLDHTPRGVIPYPFGITFGDGAPVPRHYILAIRKAIWDETLSFRWQQGDVLLLDNFRFGHGRFPFRGERKILAALMRTIYPETQITGQRTPVTGGVNPATAV